MKEGKFKRFLKGLGGLLLTVLIAIITGYAIVTFFVQTVNVIGPSMNPTLKDGQVVLINKIKYKFDDVERYDIIAYKKLDSDAYYDIKRVVGLPDETIKIENGNIYINGEVLSDYPIDTRIMNAGLAAEITLKDGEYFVLGDNVNNSEDSRYTNIGVINKTEITGKITRIIEPSEEKGRVR